MPEIRCVSFAFSCRDACIWCVFGLTSLLYILLTVNMTPVFDVFRVWRLLYILLTVNVTSVFDMFRALLLFCILSQQTCICWSTMCPLSTGLPLVCLFSHCSISATPDRTWIAQLRWVSCLMNDGFVLVWQTVVYQDVSDMLHSLCPDRRWFVLNIGPRAGSGSCGFFLLE